jgi:hypothetical protein
MEELLARSIGGEYRLRSAGISFFNRQMSCLEASKNLQEAAIQLAMIHQGRDHVSACIESRPCVLLMEKTKFHA